MIPRRARAPLAVGAAVLAATAYVGLVDPNESGHYPLCPTKLLTGLDCPGCGGLRAVHSLAHGELLGALDHNAFVVLVLLPVGVLLWAAWLRRSWTTGDGADPRDGGGPGLVDRAVAVATSRPAVVGAIAVMTVFTVVRNVGSVPALDWLGSGLAA